MKFLEFGLVGQPLSFETFFSDASNVTWDFGDGSFSTEESTTYMYDLPGVYSCTLYLTDSTQNDCTLLHNQEIVIENVLDTEEGIHLRTYDVYPNPSNGMIKIDHPLITSYKVYESTGNLIEFRQLEGKIINLYSYDRGMYLLYLGNIKWYNFYRKNNSTLKFGI